MVFVKWFECEMQINTYKFRFCDAPKNQIHNYYFHYKTNNSELMIVSYL